jgi:SAM-dependent methyltransferase
MNRNRAHPDHALETFECMAPFYDAFTAHHDYELWLGNLLPELRERGLPEHGRLLDLACGTGKSFLPLLSRGWTVTGVDASPAMLAEAQAKTRGLARLVRADLRDLPCLGQFDLVWCLDDAVNYLLAPDELTACFAGVRRNLAPTGLSLFDVDALASYRGFFATTEVVAHDEGHLIWRGQTPKNAGPGVQARAELEVRDGRGRLVERIVHRQRHYSVSEVAACLDAAGLELVDVFGHGTDAVLEQPLDEARHTKAIFITRIKERR